ncbi:MAG: dTDP-4-dehydrorhamnose reductase [Gemmatimonadales bacterium]
MPIERLILLTGGTGQIGWELRRELAPLGRVVAPGRDVLDLARPETLRETIRRLRPDLVVNAAAYTAVDRAESEPDECYAINATGPGVLAEEAARLKAVLVHYSTDYVFDGVKRSPYLESDATGPLGVYGRSKLEGDRSVLAASGRCLVLRTGWVYGLRGKNFFRTILRLARERAELRVVDDQIGAPTWCRQLASATAQLLGQDPGVERPGLYHITAGGQTSWYGFAEAILRLDPRGDEQVCRTVHPIPTSEYPTPAARPAWSVLSCEKLATAFRLRLPTWDVQLEMMMEERAESGHRA